MNDRQTDKNKINYIMQSQQPVCTGKRKSEGSNYPLPVGFPYSPEFLSASPNTRCTRNLPYPKRLPSSHCSGDFDTMSLSHALHLSSTTGDKKKGKHLTRRKQSISRNEEKKIECLAECVPCRNSQEEINKHETYPRHTFPISPSSS